MPVHSCRTVADVHPYDVSRCFLFVAVQYLTWSLVNADPSRSRRRFFYRVVFTGSCLICWPLSRRFSFWLALALCKWKTQQTVLEELGWRRHLPKNVAIFSRSRLRVSSASPKVCPWAQCYFSYRFSVSISISVSILHKICISAWK